MTETKHADIQRSDKGQFLKGSKGLGGRARGSRNKLGEAFIDALYNDFQANGTDVITKVRAERPHEYLKICASLLPKELIISTDDNLTDEQLDQRIRQLASVLELEFSKKGTDGTAGGEAQASTQH